MEPNQTGQHVAGPRLRRVDASAPATENSIETLSDIFKEAAASKKVIVIQSPGLNHNAADNKGELPDLMDAVGSSNDVPETNAEPHFVVEGNFDVNNSAESVETVSAVEGVDDVGTAHIDGEVKEVQLSVETVAQIGDNSEEIIYLNADEVRPEDVQFIDMTATHDPINEEAPVHETPTITPEVKAPTTTRRHRPPPYVSKEDAQRTRFLCPVCQKSFRQKHLLLCHIKLHDSRPRANSVYMSNCTSCGGNVRLTSEQARLLQERGTEDARIICSTCKLLGHDVVQQAPVPIELKPAFNFHCDMCSCDIKLTDDQLQLVERKGAENIRIICAPCSVKDQELTTDIGEPEKNREEIKCNLCQRPVEIVDGRETSGNVTCAECQSKYEEEMAVENINSSVEKFYAQICGFCGKEIYLNEEPQGDADFMCNDCTNKDRNTIKKGRRPLKVPTNVVREMPKAVEGLAILYKCNNCFCSMQLSDEQRELLRVRGVSGTKIICASCHVKEKSKPEVPSKKRPRLRVYQCDVCLNDMDYSFRPKDDDDDIICPTCRIVEENERFKISKDSPTDANYRCSTCHKALPLTSAQMKRFNDKGIRPRLKCTQCKDREAADEEVKSKKMKTEGIDYRCDICSVSFGGSVDKFTEHFNKVHAMGNDTESLFKDNKKTKKNRPFQCPICNADFLDRSNLTMHLISHKTELPERKVQCPICIEMVVKSELTGHYSKVHDVAVSKVVLNFETVDQLKNWKRQVEESSCCQFVLRQNGKGRKVEDGVVVKLKCRKNVKNRDGSSDFYCPAQMVIKEHSGGFNVRYTETHVGHCELSHFTKDEKDKIAQMLVEGCKVADICTELACNFDENSSDYMRIHQLKFRDLYSLKKELVDGKSGAFNGDDTDDSSLSMSDIESERLDLPETLDWLKTPQVETEILLSSTDRQIKLVETDDTIDTKDALFGTKVNLLRRLVNVLNKCTSDDHLQILDYYLKPGELTLDGLTSGQNVEIVSEDENGEGVVEDGMEVEKVDDDVIEMTESVDVNNPSQIPVDA